MTSSAEITMREKTRRAQKTRLVFKETIEPDPTNPNLYLYTAKHSVRVPRSDIKEPEVKPRKMYCSYNLLANCGFLRALCDKDGNVLAYTRGMQIWDKNLIPGATRLGTWYVFEEYNVNRLTDFKIEIWPSVSDTRSAVWDYDSENRCYTLTTPATAHAPSKDFWFFVGDTAITSNMNDDVEQRYEYPVKTEEPNSRIVRGVRAAMHYAGFLSGPKPPIQDSFYPWLVLARQK